MLYCNQITGVYVPVQNVIRSINNNYQINNPVLKEKTFESFVPDNPAVHAEEICITKQCFKKVIIFLKNRCNFIKTPRKIWKNSELILETLAV